MCVYKADHTLWGVSVVCVSFRPGYSHISYTTVSVFVCVLTAALTKWKQLAASRCGRQVTRRLAGRQRGEFEKRVSEGGAVDEQAGRGLDREDTSTSSLILSEGLKQERRLPV